MTENETEKAKSEEASRSAETETPEVEAEIVAADDEPVRRETDAAPEVDPDRAGKAVPRGLLKRHSPGLLVFFAFIAVSVAAFAIWRIQVNGPDRSGSEREAAEAPQETEAEAATGAGNEASRPASSQETVTPASDKILNSIDPALKKESETAATGRDRRRGLPSPPAPGSANADLQQAAKDAVRRAIQEDEGDAIDSPERDDRDPEPQIEFRPLESEGEAVEQAQRQSASVGSAAPDEETARLKAALAQEKQRSEERARELDSLREKFRQARQEGEAAAEKEIAALRAEIADLRALHRLNNQERPAAALAMISLSRAIEAGEPYAPALEAVKRQALDLHVPPVLDAAAESGLPTLAELKLAFPSAARVAIVAYAKENARGPAGRLIAEFQNIVTVRPAQPSQGEEAPAIISRAAHHLERDRLEDAVSEVRALHGAPAEAFNRWFADAESVVQARAAINRMSAELTEAMKDMSGSL